MIVDSDAMNYLYKFSRDCEVTFNVMHLLLFKKVYDHGYVNSDFLTKELHINDAVFRKLMGSLTLKKKIEAGNGSIGIIEFNSRTGHYYLSKMGKQFAISTFKLE